jgi:uncharacterized protein (DUF433 family)
MDWHEWIERRPGVMTGKPVFKNTRITVEHVLERLGEGATVDDLFRAHPRLRVEHIQAALAFAA